jgi:hypothetical protein
MRSVRCDACGVKALVAASKCPKCAHLFEVRDGFGELLPLAYCSSCASFYPEHRGSCKWCGTKPERAPLAPVVWKAAGVVAFFALAGVAWLARDREATSAAQKQELAQGAVDPMSFPAESIASNPIVVPAGAVDTQPASRAADTQPALTAADTQPASAPADTFTPSATPPVVASAKPAQKAASKPPTVAPSKARPSSRWVNSVSRSWIVVRADASKAARIVASIGPNSRVQLGESRGDWRRIRAKGLAGWVEHRAFFARARPSRRSRGLAAR